MSWPTDAKLRLLANLQTQRWRRQARTAATRPCGCGLSHSQLEPEGDWLVWYLRGGRGAGKTRTGAETLAKWIRAAWLDGDTGEWAIVAPTFGDARSVCVEGQSGLLRALGPLVVAWNRSEGVIRVVGDGVVYLDGADDGALRIQGKNLRGLWADEVGLWRDWDRAWNESIRFAVRMTPGRRVVTGTPKMAHPLIAQLLAAPNVVEHHMPTLDNVANLDELLVEDMFAEFGGSTLGRQELEGEYIEALEGAILRRTDWRYYPVKVSFYGRDLDARALPRFERIVISWDTALKDKTSSDFAAGQVWGCKGPDRYLLRLWHGHAGLNATIEAMRELRYWVGSTWPNVATSVLVENTANGPDAIAEMRREIDGVHCVAAKGDKVQRALSAAVSLETGHCYLPGSEDPTASGRGYGADTPTVVQAFVEECAMFRGDMKHAHDDQVDAWSQMVNWTRQQRVASATVSRSRVRVPEVGSLAR